NQAPTIASPASVSPGTITGTTTSLSVLGADDGGEANLRYTWSELSGPAAIAFSTNGTNAARNTSATFTQAGNYTFRVTVTDAGGLSTTSDVSATVTQTLTSISVAPATVTVSNGATQQFTALAQDQFGNALAASFTWSIDGGGVGTVDSSGLYTAPASG